MATPETAVAPPPDPRKPSSAATLAAATSGAFAAGRVAVAPTLTTATATSQAVASATAQIVEALARFARLRQATIIPLLQRQLTETFVNRQPDEIAKLLGKEAMRERQFQKRQAARMRRDLPGVLAEADLVKRKAAMDKLMAREQRYMAQREQAMTARAHSVIESLDLQDASPDGAFWMLGGAIHHTAGCIAMSGKFWPWAVLREVAIPPVHPGCACQLIALGEASKHGLVAPHQLPDVKDALARARRYMELEEAFEDAEPDEAARAVLVEAVLTEAERRYAKGMEHGGEFMPKVGGDFSAAKGALRKLLTGRGEDRHVWLRGHRVLIPHGRSFSRKIGGTKFTSPAHSTNVYRDGELVSVEGEAPTHPDMERPSDAPAAAVAPVQDVPKSVSDAEDAASNLIREQITQRLAKSEPPVDVGLPAGAAHKALVHSGFTFKSKVRPKYLQIDYAKDGHALGVRYSRTDGKIGKVDSIDWKPASGSAKAKSGGYTPGPKLPFKGGGGHTGAPSAFVKAKPLPPVVHPALSADPVMGSAFPNFDHVELKVRPHSDVAEGPQGERYALRQAHPDHVASALLANSVYRTLGARVPALGVRHLPEPDFASIPDVDLGEKPIDAGGKRTSSGIILRHPNGDVTLFEPKNHYGGYEHTFPKGGVEDGLTAQQNAHKELWEETGLHAHITGLVGDYQGDTSVSRYYTGVLTGGEPTTGPETEAVKTVAPAEAEKLLNKDRDKQILADVVANHEPPTGDAPADAFPDMVNRPALLAPQVDAESQYLSNPSKAFGRHFMADALLANWSVLGSGDKNVRWADDKPVRLSQTGALGYRSSGDSKPFGPVPHEVWSMLGPKGEAFGKADITEQDRRDQAGEIERLLPPEKVDALVDAAPFENAAARESVRGALKGRVAWMGAYHRGEVSEPEPLQGVAAAAELSQSQEGLDLFPEQHAAIAMYPAEMDAIEAHLQSGAKTDGATEDQRMIVKELDSVLRFVRTEDDVTAYIGVDPVALLGGKESIVGKTLANKGFLNMTLTEGEARLDPGVVQLTIPAGSHALYTRGVPGVDDVDARTPDMIGQRNSRLRIVGQAERDGKTYFEAVLLP